MFCPKCGTENPDGAVFCAGCGTRIELTASVEKHVAQSNLTDVNNSDWKDQTKDAAKQLAEGLAKGTTIFMGNASREAARMAKDTSEGVIKLTNLAADKVENTYDSVVQKVEEAKTKKEGARAVQDKVYAEQEKSWQNYTKTGMPQQSRTEDMSEEKGILPQQPSKQKKKGGIGKALLLVAVLIVGCVFLYQNIFTVVGVWKVEPVQTGISKLDIAQEIISNATDLAITKDGRMGIFGSFLGLTGGLNMQYEKSIRTLSIAGSTGFGDVNENFSYRFDGPDRIVLTFNGIDIGLQRDRSRDPDELMTHSIGIGSFDEEGVDLDIDQAVEEGKEKIDETFEKLTNFLGDR